MKELTPDRTPLLDSLLTERIGLNASRYGAYRQHLVDLAMARAGARDEAGFVAHLRTDAHAFDELVSDLTIPESYFFRDDKSFVLLRNEVLPALRRIRPRQHVITLWSAGCAGGEEAYSLAIMLEQEGLSERARVLGTDVSTRSLARAREALYPQWSLRASSQQDIRKYFHEEGNKFRLMERLRSRVSFQKHSLISLSYPTPPQGFDLVLCRNVLIYFTADAVSGTAQRLARSLAEGGYLLLGPSDPILDLTEWCEVSPTTCGMLYRKAGTRVRPARPKLEPAHVVAASALPERAIPRVRKSVRRKVPSLRPAQRPSELPPSVTPYAAVHGLASEHGPRAAEVACRELLAEHPLSAELQLAHASLLVDLGRHQDAEEAIRRALYLDRTLLPAQFLSATLRERRGDKTAARRLYESVAEHCRTHPDDAVVPFGDGLTYGTFATLAQQRSDVLGDAAPHGRRSDSRGTR